MSLQKQEFPILSILEEAALKLSKLPTAQKKQEIVFTIPYDMYKDVLVEVNTMCQLHQAEVILTSITILGRGGERFKVVCDEINSVKKK